MARLVFTQQLRRFTDAPEVETHAASLRAALEDAFTATPRLRGYVLDDQGHLRPNVVVFVDGPDKSPLIIQKSDGGYLYGTTAAGGRLRSGPRAAGTMQ